MTAYPQYPAPGYHPPTPRPPKTSTKGPTVMLLCGIGALVLAVAGIVGAVIGFTGLAQLETGARPVALVDGTAQVVLPPLTPGTDYVLCSATTLPVADVTVTEDSAQGDPIPLSVPSARVSVTIDGHSLVPQVQFTAGDADGYVVTFDSSTGPAPWEGLWVAEYAPFERFGWNLFSAVGGIIAAVFCGLAGLGLTIGGAVWRSRRVRNAQLLRPQDPRPPMTTPAR